MVERSVSLLFRALEGVQQVRLGGLGWAAVPTGGLLSVSAVSMPQPEQAVPHPGISCGDRRRMTD